MNRGLLIVEERGKPRLYHTERGDPRDVSYTKSRKEAFASWENITTHYFSRGKWIMTESE